MYGGTYVKGVSSWGNNDLRDVKYVKPGETLGGSFECVPFPPGGSYSLVVSAKSFRVEPPALEFVLNGKTLWRGDAFRAYYFTRKTLELPVEALARHNKFEIKNISDDNPPDRRIVIHYAVVKKRY